MSIHPRAIVHSRAEIPGDADVGPYAVIGDKVRVGRGTRVGAHAVIHPHVTMGDGNEVFSYAAIGEDPQHTGYGGEETLLTIGHRNCFREFVTIHRGTPQGGGLTVIGDDCLFMAYAHVAHDCRIGNGVIMANAVQLAGHVEVGDCAVVGGLTAVHQHVRIGDHCMVGGAAALAQDAPPYSTVAGNRAVLRGMNLKGLSRRGFGPEKIAALKKAYRLLFRSGLTVAEAVERARREIPGSPEVENLLRFVESSPRGICR